MKLFKKIKFENGERKFFILGIPIFSYKKKELSYVEKARLQGVKVGENCVFVTMPSFGTEPYFITIGDNVKISFDVTFLTHDGGIWVGNNLEKTDYSKLGEIKIGNNCFIGCRTIIMPNVTIGNNCVIGAGSIVTKNVPDGEVWAGNPAHFIKTTSEYHKQIEKINTEEKQQNMKNFVETLRGTN